MLIVQLTRQQKLKTATAAASALERSTSLAADASASSPEVRRAAEEGNNHATAEQQFQEGHAKDDEGLPRQEVPDNDKGAAAGSNTKSKPQPGDGLLLELIRGFRAGMLRVDSNLRAAMFRAVRYLVRVISRPAFFLLL